jgi:hypothetical protein
VYPWLKDKLVPRLKDKLVPRLKDKFYISLYKGGLVP